MRTLPILLRKEFLQFRRNPLLLRLALIFPVMVLLIMPLVATMDVKHVGVAVVDHDGTTLSRRITATLSALDFFSVSTATTYADAMEQMERGTADVVLTLPDGLAAGEAMPDVAANGVNGIKGSLGSTYVMQAVSSVMAGKSADASSATFLFNPTLDYRHFMIPALMIMLLIMLCGFMPALNMAGEKESGTIEQINVTPVRPFVFILSKLIPYWVLGLVVLTIGMTLAAAVYGLTPAGSIGAIYLAAFLCILVMSGLGVLIANFSSTMTRSMFLMFFIVMLFVLMSGLLTPVDSMPDWAQCITLAIPPRFFIDIIRSIYLKGTPASALTTCYLALAAYALLYAMLAAATYRKRT